MEIIQFLLTALFCVDSILEWLWSQALITIHYKPTPTLEIYYRIGQQIGVVLSQNCIVLIFLYLEGGEVKALYALTSIELYITFALPYEIRTLSSDIETLQIYSCELWAIESHSCCSTTCLYHRGLPQHAMYIACSPGPSSLSNSSRPQFMYMSIYFYDSSNNSTAKACNKVPN